MNEIKEVIDSYNREVEENLKEIEEILASLKMKSPDRNDFKDLFSGSSNTITNSWKTGRKYCRTIFTRAGFKEEFPDEYLTTSLSLDVMINILDDLLDEYLPEEKKTAYVIEFLRNFANYNHKKLPLEIRDGVGTYFNKLITLALSEKVYQEKIRINDDLHEISKSSVDLLMCRGMDVDIFVEIALINYGGDGDAIRKNARLFRAMNILKKDIIDIPYDLKNQMETVVTVVKDKNFNFIDYIDDILSLFTEMTVESEDEVALNFMNMIEEQKKEISELAKSL